MYTHRCIYIYISQTKAAGPSEVGWGTSEYNNSHYNNMMKIYEHKQCNTNINNAITVLEHESTAIVETTVAAHKITPLGSS